MSEFLNLAWQNYPVRFHKALIMQRHKNSVPGWKTFLTCLDTSTALCACVCSCKRLLEKWHSYPAQPLQFHPSSHKSRYHYKQLTNDARTKKSIFISQQKECWWHLLQGMTSSYNKPCMYFEMIHIMQLKPGKKIAYCWTNHHKVLFYFCTYFALYPCTYHRP